MVKEIKDAVKELDIETYEKITSEEIEKKEVDMQQVLLSIGGIGFGSYLFL